MDRLFRKTATFTSNIIGSPLAFIAAFILIAAWLITGPVFNFSDTWQLVMTTATNVITFIIVFLLQYTQNRDSKATQLKLDELIRAVEKARNSFVNAEELSDNELEQIQEQFKKIMDKGKKEESKDKAKEKISDKS